VTVLKLALIFGVAALAPLGTALAAGDAQSGQMIFTASCGICHKVGPEAANALGPVLNGIVGRKAGAFANYNYSAANLKSGLTWDEATLTKYLHSPMAVVPDTAMIFAGLTDDQQVADVIAYLKTFGPDGKPAAR
jgi:cytochrome c